MERHVGWRRSQWIACLGWMAFHLGGCLPGEPLPGPTPDAAEEDTQPPSDDAAPAPDAQESDHVAVDRGAEVDAHAEEPRDARLDVSAPEDADAGTTGLPDLPDEPPPVMDAGADAPDTGPADCESLPSTSPPTGAPTELLDWPVAWRVPLRHGVPTRTEPVSDGVGNTYLANAVPWTERFPVSETARPNDVLIASLDADGNPRWTVRTVGAAPSVESLRSMLGGGVVATFGCDGVVTAGMIRCAASDRQMVVARFRADGSLAWTQTLNRASRYLDANVARDDADNLYLFYDDDTSVSASPTRRRLTRLDANGAVRWSIATSPDEGEMWFRGGEVVIARVVNRDLRWSRRGADGALIRRGSFALEPAFRSSYAAQLLPAPDGGFHIAWVQWHTDILTGADTEFTTLERFDPCGQSLWARHPTPSLDSARTGWLRADPAGNVCWQTNSWSIAPPRRPGRQACYLDRRSWQIEVYGPDGALLRSVSPTLAQYSFDFSCEAPQSALGVVYETWAPTGEFTLGDRHDPTEVQAVLTRRAPPATALCPGHEHRCGGRCVDTTASVEHCGACGRACRIAHGPGRCLAGNCVAGACDDGFADCDGDLANGCETDLRASPSHCGACGRACATGACTQGRCCAGAVCTDAFASDGHEGAFAPTRDVTLGAGVHQFTTVTIPAGVTVRADGDGVLELRASGDIQIDGAIDLSGGDGASGAAPGMPSEVVEGGGGGHTGRPGAARAGSDGAGSGGGGVGTMGTRARSSGPTSDAHGGLGVAGGASGQGYRSVWFCTPPLAQPATGPDGGRSLSVGFTEGGRAWGAPYDGHRGSSPGPLMCLFPGDDLTREANYTETGAPAGGGSIGHLAAIDLGVFTTFRPGSGGGGGPANLAACSDVAGAGGGGGGGALRVASSSRITIGPRGSVRANGGAGGTYAGAGSGGVVYLAAPALYVARGAVVESRGGRGPTDTAGLGRVRLSIDPSRCTLDGAFNPPLRDGCRPTPAGGTPGHVYVGAWPR